MILIVATLLLILLSACVATRIHINGSMYKEYPYLRLPSSVVLIAEPFTAVAQPELESKRVRQDIQHLL